MPSLSPDKIYSEKCLTFIGHASVCAEDLFASVTVIYSSARVYGLSDLLKILHFCHISFAHFLAIICYSHLNHNLTI